MRTTFLILLLAVGLLARPANAQSNTAPVPARSALFPPMEALTAADTTHLAEASALRALMQAKDYRWEGFGIGAVGLGLFTAYAGHEFCANSEDRDQSCVLATIGGALLGGVVGGITGGLIGGLITKP